MVECTKCDGSGIEGARILPDSVGSVQTIQCRRCNGTGKEPRTRPKTSVKATNQEWRNESLLSGVSEGTREPEHMTRRP